MVVLVVVRTIRMNTSIEARHDEYPLLQHCDKGEYGMNTQLLIPRGGSLINKGHCIQAATTSTGNVARTVFALHDKWRGVISKIYHLGENEVTHINIMLMPMNKDQTYIETESKEGIEEVTALNTSIGEMLETIAKDAEVKRNGVLYRLQRKVFYKNGNNWTCELIARIEQDEVILRRDNISHDQFIFAARTGDIIAHSNSRIDKKTFKLIRDNTYSVTLEAAGETYNSSRNIDFNHVFFVAAHGDQITTTSATHVIDYKFCDEKPSNSEAFDIYLAVS